MMPTPFLRQPRSSFGRYRPLIARAGLWIALASALSIGPSGCAGVRAVLPMYSEIPAGDPLPIDGIWRLVENEKRYKISAGRAWLLEEHFVGPLRYDPGQVTSRDLFQTGPLEYKGQDLASMGPITMTARGDELDLLIATPLGPVRYTMESVKIDNPSWYAAQLDSQEILANPDSRVRPQSGSPLDAQPNALAELEKSGGPLSANARASFGGYHALVIGNNNYRSLPALETAIADASAVTALLRDQYAFNVTLLENATRADILTALRRLRESLTTSDNLLIYYAGHGWLDKEVDEGYWLPIDADSESDVHWISNATITGYLRAIQAKHVMIVADSCYSGTLTRGIKLEVKSPDYLTRLSSQRARIVMSSGGLEPVTDGGGSGHSAFARHFLDRLSANQQVLDSTSLYADIRRPVMLAADQAPELADIRKAGHEGGDFLFVRAEK